MSIGVPNALGTINTSAIGSINTTLTTTAAVASGESIIVAINYPHATAILSSVSDTVGNIYTIDESLRHPTDTARYIAMASCHNAIALPSGSTITAVSNISVAAIRTLTAISVSGLATSSTKDKSSSDAGNSTTWATGSTGTLSQQNEIAIAFAMSLAATANTPISGWTEITDFAPQAGRRCVLQYQIVSSNSALNAGGTWATGVWIGIIATYKSAVSTPMKYIRSAGSFSAKPFQKKIGGVFS